jgi:histidinol-phosphate aminotransferase
VEQVYPSDANFLLVKIKEATSVYNILREKGIIVRNRSNVVLCDDSLRITVGTKEENDLLIKELKQLQN